MIPLLLKLKKGKHEGKRKVHKYRVKSIELDLEESINFNVDGEKIVDKKFNITILPKAITYFNDDEFVKKCMEGKQHYTFWEDFKALIRIVILHKI